MRLTAYFQNLHTPAVPGSHSRIANFDTADTAADNIDCSDIGIDTARFDNKRVIERYDNIESVRRVSNHKRWTA